jgi:LytS/YehU family sensor histidine kinase
MEADYPLWPLLLGQVVFTAVAALLVLYLVFTRGRTVTEGREQAIHEALALANRTLPYLRRGLTRVTAHKTALVLHEFLQPAARCCARVARPSHARRRPSAARARTARWPRR